MEATQGRKAGHDGHDAATSALQVLAQEVAAEIESVRRDHPTLESVTRLMSRTGTHHAEDAIRAEARQRVLRARWASATTGSDA